MSLPCPQRDAFEQIEKRIKPWPTHKTTEFNSNTVFHLSTGETIHLLGVSPGAGMRKKPNLHVAVFSLEPRQGRVQNLRLLKQCSFGALITLMDDGSISAQGLSLSHAIPPAKAGTVGNEKTRVIPGEAFFRKSGGSAQYWST